MSRLLLLLLPLAAAAPLAGAEEPELVLRMATVAPDGSPWAAEFKKWIRDVESGTNHHMRVKVYYNGVAGDEVEEGERIRKGQLDGTTSGNMLAERVAPSLHITHLPGLYRSRAEATAILNRLQPVFAAEAHRNGFAFLGAANLGPDVIFTRVPVHSLSELKRLKLWRWDLDEAGLLTARTIGLNVVALPISEAARAYDEGRVDGFICVPTGALVYQWSVRARYLLDLRESYLAAGMLISERFFAALPPAYQQTLRNATVTLTERFEALGRRIDAQLLGGLFQKQGVTLVPISDAFSRDYFAAATAARPRVVERFISADVMDQVEKTLAELRAGKRGGEGKR
jgi:TRAP-type C4-dicarboxylate transport system substrate-binding protein